MKGGEFDKNPSLREDWRVKTQSIHILCAGHFTEGEWASVWDVILSSHWLITVWKSHLHTIIHIFIYIKPDVSAAAVALTKSVYRTSPLLLQLLLLSSSLQCLEGGICSKMSVLLLYTSGWFARMDPNALLLL